MQTFKQLLESKQLGIIYHFTSFKGFLSIVSSNTLKGSDLNTGMAAKNPVYKQRQEFHSGENNYICFTRNKFWYKDFKVPLCIIFDGDKLTNDYHFKPVDFRYNQNTKEVEKEKRLGVPSAIESEERLILPKGKTEIKNISQYIIGAKFGDIATLKNHLQINWLNKDDIKSFIDGDPTKNNMLKMIKGKKALQYFNDNIFPFQELNQKLDDEDIDELILTYKSKIRNSDVISKFLEMFCKSYGIKFID